jgi:HSP20 family protein
MTLVKWKKPSSNGQLNKPLIYKSPFQELFPDLFPEGIIGPGPHFTPAANILEEEKEYSIELAVPGFDKTDFKIALKDRVLSISGNREEKEKPAGQNPAHLEFRQLSFNREFTLPESIDEEAISARYENGILKVVIPKGPDAQARTILVS